MEHPKLLIIGHGRHGKDTAAWLLHDMFGMTYQSSSLAAARIFIYDELKELYGYSSFDECYEDRHNHRAEWFNLITTYNTPDKTRLARAIMATSDCYVGMRDREEILACMDAGVFNLVVWVDSTGRGLPTESRDSFDIDMDIADIVIYNNGSTSDLKNKLARLGTYLFR